MTTTRLLRAFLLCSLFTLILNQSWSQNKTVTGKITNENGNPVVGASVLVKGTSIGTTTDGSGSFSFSVPSSSNMLTISYVGYGAQDVSIATSNDVAISLSPDGTSLTDVVVVGYGTVKKKDLTGSVASIKADDFNQGVITAPDQLIQGKAAGVLVINNSGQPGGSTTVRIRGSSSIRSGNQPLFVVDGVPLSGGAARPGYNGGAGFGGNDPGNPLTFINPNDIASIDILKDASATAIYGSRGSNGVVIITTKRGTTGVPSLDVSSSVGFSSLLKKLDVLNGDEYRKALSDYGISGQGDFGANEDAFDAITQTGLTQNYNVAMSGGNETGRYRLSLGYLDQEGIIKESGLKKYTANLNSSFKFLESKKLGLDINITASNTYENIAPISTYAGFEGNLIGAALQWNPTHPLIYPGTDSIWIDPAVGQTTLNPLALLAAYNDNARTNTIIANISPSYKIATGLEYKFIYSVYYQTGTQTG